VKVRYYGFFGASVRRKLAALQICLGNRRHHSLESQSDSSPSAEKARRSCPTCGLPMIFKEIYLPSNAVLLRSFGSLP
jgi:hypothetical protein